ncbi:SGNH/GDSL hydrolase family protein [Streptomyces sp. NPDC058412]|uniref:SGNH/GDSL hydrolase family protein n=1 Tax=Streptomyces sp. NPDC058412 TaxID=3346486 RepID=UPI0036471B11
MRSDVPMEAWKRVRRRLLKSLVKPYAAVLLRQPLWDARGVVSPCGRYGPGGESAMPFVLLGDSSAVTVGVLERQETIGAQLAGMLSSRLECAVELDVLARAGATTAALARQVRSVTGRNTPGVAFILIGGNDVMLPASVSRSAARLGHYVRELRGAGWEVVVGSCADIGAAPALRRGVAAVASVRSRRLARLQSAAVLAAGGRVVVLETDAFRRRPAQLYCPDGFHPSPEGYRVYLRLAGSAVAGAGEAWLRQSVVERRGSVQAVGPQTSAPQEVAVPARALTPAQVRLRTRVRSGWPSADGAHRLSGAEREPA